MHAASFNPLQGSGNLTTIERNYNLKLTSNKYVIERCFGLLKQKLRQLFHVKLIKIGDIAHFIRACCVLHNLSSKDGFPADGIEEALPNVMLPLVGDQKVDENINRNATEHRNFVARQI